jgi:cell division septation protein DedD
VRKDPLAALDRLAEGKGEMTYPAALRGAEAPVADVDRVIEAKKPEPPKAPEAAKASEKKPEAAKPEDKKPEDKKPDDKKPVPAANDDGPVAKPDAAPKAAAAAASNSKAKFTLQLSAFQEQSEADAFLATVKGAGYGAYVVSAEVDGKMFYRVRLGNYGSYDEAVAAKAEFERKVPKIAYVTRL